MKARRGSQASSRHRPTSSRLKRTPPIGAPKAADTPAAAPADTKSCGQVMGEMAFGGWANTWWCPEAAAEQTRFSVSMRNFLNQSFLMLIKGMLVDFPWLTPAATTAPWRTQGRGRIGEGKGGEGKGSHGGEVDAGTVTWERKAATYRVDHGALLADGKATGHRKEHAHGLDKQRLQADTAWNLGSRGEWERKKRRE